MNPTRRTMLAVGALGVLVFAGSLANDFAYDDVSVIVRDPGIQSLATLPGRLLEPYWPDSAGARIGAWRPVTTGAWGLMWIVGGGAAWIFHAAAAVLHGAVSALVVALLATLMPLGAAAAAGVVFAVHPVHVEAVANVVGGAEVLAALFALLACLVHVRGGERHGWQTILALAGLYAVALLSKESAAPLPAALLLLDAARRDLVVGELGAYLRRRGSTFAALAVVLGAVLLARSVILQSAASTPVPLGGAILNEIPRAWTVTGSWSHYVRLLLFPVSLSSDYAPALVPIAFDLTSRTLAGALLVVGSLGMAAAAWRRGGDVSAERLNVRVVGMGVLWIAVMLLPVANVLYLSPVLVSERGLYLPSVGFAACLGYGAAVLAVRNRSAAVAATALVAVLFAARTAQRVPDWKDTDTVVASLAADHPESGRAQWVLGNQLIQEGQPREGLRSFALAVGTLDGAYPVLVDLGSQLRALGRPASSAFILRQAWRDEPETELAPRLLVALLRSEGMLPEAVSTAREALTLTPDSLLLLDQLSVALSDLGEHEAAVDARGRALALGLGEAWRWWLAQAEDLGALGRVDELSAALDTARVLAEAEGPASLEELLAASAVLQGRSDEPEGHPQGPPS